MRILLILVGLVFLVCADQPWLNQTACFGKGDSEIQIRFTRDYMFRKEFYPNLTWTWTVQQYNASMQGYLIDLPLLYYNFTLSKTCSNDTYVSEMYAQLEADEDPYRYQILTVNETWMCFTAVIPLSDLGEVHCYHKCEPDAFYLEDCNLVSPTEDQEDRWHRVAVYMVVLVILTGVACTIKGIYKIPLTGRRYEELPLVRTRRQDPTVTLVVR